MSTLNKKNNLKKKPTKKKTKAANRSLATASWNWILIILCWPLICTCSVNVTGDKWENKKPGW